MFSSLALLLLLNNLCLTQWIADHRDDIVNFVFGGDKIHQYNFNFIMQDMFMLQRKVNSDPVLCHLTKLLFSKGHLTCREETFLFGAFGRAKFLFQLRFHTCDGWGSSTVQSYSAVWLYLFFFSTAITTTK